MAYYYYKVKTDNGGAPCVYRGLLSLAICKAQIRSTANKDDWIFGFGARTTIGEKLIYIAKITDKVPDGNYYGEQKYQGRPDCIYEWTGAQLHWRPGSRYHEGGDESDIGKPPHTRAAVLLSRDFRYFGNGGTQDYKKTFPVLGEAVSQLARGHRVNHPEELERELTELHEQTWSQFDDKKLGNPTHSDKSRRCNQIEGNFERGSC